MTDIISKVYDWKYDMGHTFSNPVELAIQKFGTSKRECIRELLCQLSSGGLHICTNDEETTIYVKATASAKHCVCYLHTDAVANQQEGRLVFSIEPILQRLDDPSRQNRAKILLTRIEGILEVELGGTSDKFPNADLRGISFERARELAQPIMQLAALLPNR